MRPLLRDVLAFVWLCALSLYVLGGVLLAPFHGDESTQIYMGRDFFYMTDASTLERVFYSDTPVSPTEQALRLLNGTLPKMVYGALASALGYTPATLNEQWEWGADFAYNERTNRLPPQDLLTWARVASAFGLVVGVWGLYLLGKNAFGEWAGILACTLFALHPDVLLNGRRAMMEGFMLGFSVLAVWAGVRALRARAVFGVWQFLGFVSALAVASKHTAAFTVASVFVALALLALFARPFRLRHTIGQAVGLLIAAALAVAGFLALNPAWWSAPLERVQTVLELRQNLLEGQVATFGGYADAQAQAVGFLRQVFTPTPQYYEVEAWASYLDDDIRAYEASLWAGGGDVWRAAWAIGVALGLASLAQTGRTLTSAQWLVVVWLAGMIGLTLGLTPLEWHRYYLPITPVLALIAGHGLVWAVQQLARQRQEARRPNDPQNPFS